MKLKRIYANKNFKNIEFNSEFNVVLADTKELDKKKDTHGLGKTSLIHVINFVLLGSFNKKVFGNKVFKGVVFYGELELNNGQFLIIRREIDTHSKVSFKVNDFKSNDFVFPSDWDFENLPFKKSREKLNEYLNFDVVSSYDYRKSITYFLRTQQDFLDVFKLNKFKGKHIDWKPFVFELLGYDGKLIVDKLDFEEKIKDKKNIIKTLKEEARIDIDEKDRLVGLLEIKEQEAQDAKQTIDKFNFYQNDTSLNQVLIEKIESEIQLLNTERYRLSYELNKIEESLRNVSDDVNLNSLEKLHKEVELFFPSELKKNFDELIQFNQAISKDRKKHLKKYHGELKTELQSVNTDLKKLESKKSELLSFLTEKDSYAKFKRYQKDLSRLEAEIERIKDKINAVDQSLSIKDEIKSIEKDVDSFTSKIRKTISKRKHAEINKTFNYIISEVLGTHALISIKQNKQGNVEFSADYQNKEDLEITSESEGTSYKKLLCMAFDLSLLKHYSNNSFFKFVYHDGVLEGLDNRIKSRILDLIKQICNENNIQYILSLIDSDIPTDSQGEKYQFSDNEIRLRLHDKDDSGKLFLHSF